MKFFAATAAMLCIAGPAYAQMDPASISELLAAHNAYRSPLGLPPLQWSATLAARAQDWANHIAATNSLTHNGAGQNLVWANGPFSLTQLVNIWGAERPNFTDSTFPAISTTGNWQDAGHYSQLVWSTTTEVGCATASNPSHFILVCNYNPPGNIEGERPY